MNNENFEEATFTPQAKLPTPGLKLPKTNESWNQANKFFKSTLDVNKEIISVNDICHLQDTFFTNIPKTNVELFQKMTYTLNSVQNTTTHQRGNLKELYLNLKVRTKILMRIKFVVSKLIRRKYTRKKTANSLIMIKRYPATFGAIAKKRSKKKR